MIETNIPEINIDELMEKIRAEVRERKKRDSVPHRTVPRANDAPPSHPYARVDLSNISGVGEPEPFQQKDEGYHINNFLRYHDQQFVINAHRGMLTRGPDLEGLNYYLKGLRTGKMTKAKMLGRLRYAPEGRPGKANICGLFWKFAIQSPFRIPVLEYFSRITAGFLNLLVQLCQDKGMEVIEDDTVAFLPQIPDASIGAVTGIHLIEYVPLKTMIALIYGPKGYAVGGVKV